MRAALKPLDGVSAVEVEPGDPALRVVYDPKRIALERILTALYKGGEPAKPKS